MHDIVVPLDGSNLSESALPWARAIAARSDADLHLVHVHIPLRVPTCREVLGEPAAQTLRQISEATREREAEYLRETRGGIREGRDSKIATGKGISAAVLRGPPGPALVDHACESNASLIVMATRPLAGKDRAWQGSVTDEVVRRCPMPVLIIRGSEGPQPEPRVDRVMVPLDGSVAAEGAVAHAIALARVFGAELRFVQVVSPGRGDPAGAERYLKGIEARTRPSGVPAESLVVVDRDVVDALIATAEGTGADVVAMASRCRSGLPRLVFGNVAGALVRNGPCPVLVVGNRALRAGGVTTRQVVAWS